MNEANVFSSSLEPKYMNQVLWNTIELLNLNLIQERMIIKHGWTKERTESAIKAYRRYLYLTQILEQSVAPTKDIDDVWHEHILHTNKYAIDCQKLFGKFLHHFPTPVGWASNTIKSENFADCKVTGCEGKCSNDNCDSGTTNDGLKITAVADCKVTGCEGKCSNDNCDSGTTNDGLKISGALVMNFDNPTKDKHHKAINYYEIEKSFFAGN